MQRKKIALVIVSAAILMAAFLHFRIQQFPENWIYVSEAIERKDLHEKIGSPSGAAWDVKGDEFMEEDLFGTWFMRVYYDENQVTREAWIYYRLGGRTHFKRINIKHIKSVLATPRGAPLSA